LLGCSRATTSPLVVASCVRTETRASQFSFEATGSADERVQRGSKRCSYPMTLGSLGACHAPSPPPLRGRAQCTEQSRQENRLFTRTARHPRSHSSEAARVGVSPDAPSESWAFDRVGATTTPSLDVRVAGLRHRGSQASSTEFRAGVVTFSPFLGVSLRSRMTGGAAALSPAALLFELVCFNVGNVAAAATLTRSCIRRRVGLPHNELFVTSGAPSWVSVECTILLFELMLCVR